MGNSYRGRPKLRRLQKPAVDKPAEQILKELRPKPPSSNNNTYREQSLKFTGSSAPSAPESSTSRQDTYSQCTIKTAITITIPLTVRTGRICARTATMMNTVGESLVIIYGRQRRTNLSESVYNPSTDRTHDLSSNAFIVR